MGKKMNPDALAGATGARKMTNAVAGVSDLISNDNHVERTVSTSLAFRCLPSGQLNPDHIWSGTRPIEGTPGESYLRAHGAAWVPPLIRFHPAAAHPQLDRPIPAICVAIEIGDHRMLVGIRIRYLFPPDIDPRGKHRVLQLGGACGGSVRLADGPGPLVAGEGVMACLGALDRPGLDDAGIVAVFTPGDLACLDLPGVPRDLLICPGRRRASRGFAVCLFIRAKQAGWNPRIHFADGRPCRRAARIDARVAS